MIVQRTRIVDDDGDVRILLRYSDNQPRDPHGKFAPGGGETGPDSQGPGSGRDITTNGAALGRVVAASEKYPEATADARHAPLARALADEQGFAGPPKVVSRQEMDALVAAGNAEMFRGIGGQDAAAHAESYRTGEPFYTTNAAYGQGMYFTPDRAYAESYARDGEVLRVALDRNARVISYEEAHAGAKADFDTALAAYRPGDSVNDLMVYHDPGNWAMAKGYDAISATSSFGDEIVVLNRTATYVERA